MLWNGEREVWRKRWGDFCIVLRGDVKGWRDVEEWSVVKSCFINVASKIEFFCVCMCIRVYCCVVLLLCCGVLKGCGRWKGVSVPT